MRSLLQLISVVVGTSAQLTGSGFVAYFNYDGNLDVGGTIGPVTTVGTTQTIFYSLTGLDPMCQSGPSTTPNSCGLHVHRERTCTADAGPHYFTGTVTSDPWVSISYTSSADNTASSSIVINTGATSDEIEGRAFLVHAFDGSRIACVTLSAGGAATTYMAEAFVPYFNYAGPLEVAGSVGPVSTSGTTQLFSYSLTGVDQLCQNGPSGAPNSCGLHIHRERTCTGDAGPHFFTGEVTSDPWLTVGYTSTADNTTTGTLAVTSGATAAELNGRAFLVHSFDGTRVSCAILGALPSSVPISRSSGLSDGVIAAIALGSFFGLFFTVGIAWQLGAFKCFHSTQVPAVKSTIAPPDAATAGPSDRV